MSRLDTLILAQGDLIAALDTADPRRIDAATTRMAEAVENLKTQGSDATRADAARLRDAHRSNIEAAKRVNSLTNWTRSKIERIEELRGHGSAQGGITY